MILTLNILLLLLGLLLFGNINNKYENAINHVTIYSVVWTFIIIGSQVSGFVSFVPSTLVIVYLSWYLFMLGSIRNRLIYKKEVPDFSLNLNRLKVICYGLVILSIAANIDALERVFLNFTTLQDWAGMRNEKALSEFRDGNIFYTLFGTTYGIYLPLSIYLFVEKKISRISLIIVSAVAMLVAVSGFTRAPVLNIVIIVIVFYANHLKVVPRKLIIISLIAMFFIFVVSSKIIDEVGNSSSDSNSVISVYLFGGIAAYQNLLTGAYRDFQLYDSNYYSMDFLNYILKTLGVINSYPSLVREYDNIYPTNVYTYLDCFTLDFGIYGALFGSFVMGFLCSKVYQLYISTYSVLGLVLYSSFCYYTAFIFMNNEFIRFGVVILVLKVLILQYFVKLKFFSTN